MAVKHAFLVWSEIQHVGNTCKQTEPVTLTELRPLKVLFIHKSILLNAVSRFGPQTANCYA